MEGQATAWHVPQTHRLISRERTSGWKRLNGKTPETLILATQEQVLSTGLIGSWSIPHLTGPQEQAVQRCPTDSPTHNSGV